MEDFRLQDMYYEHAGPDAGEPEQSIHPEYHFRLSARDMARFGYLFLREGSWNGKQIVPRDWVKESTTSYSLTGGASRPAVAGYGYLWWVNAFDLPVKSYSAAGAPAKYIVVIPERDLVIVYQNHEPLPDASARLSTEQIQRLPAPTKAQLTKLVTMLVDAQRSGQ